MSTLDIFDGSLDHLMFFGYISLHFLVQIFFLNIHIWQNLGFGVYWNVRFKLKSFQILSYGQSVLSFILNGASIFAKGICSITFPEVSRFM